MCYNPLALCIVLLFVAAVPAVGQKPGERSSDQELRSSNQIGIRVIAAERKDTITPGVGVTSRWPTPGNWLVVRTVAPRETGLLEVRLTEASGERQLRPSFRVVEFQGAPGEVWQGYDTTRIAFAQWVPRTAEIDRIQIVGSDIRSTNFIFDVTGMRQPYRFHVDRMCFAVAGETNAAAPAPCVSARIVSATTRDSAAISDSFGTRMRSGPFLLVWTDFTVIGEREVAVGAASLVSAQSRFDHPPDALVFDTLMKSTGPFVSVTASPHSDSPNGKVAVRFRARDQGGAELTLQGRQTIGFLFYIGHLQPPYGLEFADSTRAIPLNPVVRKGPR